LVERVHGIADTLARTRGHRVNREIDFQCFVLDQRQRCARGIGDWRRRFGQFVDVGDKRDHALAAVASALAHRFKIELLTLGVAGAFSQCEQLVVDGIEQRIRRRTQACAHQAEQCRKQLRKWR